MKLNIFLKKLESLNRIEILKDNILFNFDFFKKTTNKDIFPVIKSNAYGHGIEEIVNILKSRKIEYLICDSYYEALRVWRINKKQKVLIMGYNILSNLKYYNFKKIALAVYDKKTISCLGELNKKIKIHLKIDTGMGRQGIYVSEVGEYINLIKQYKNLELEGACSHLADSDNIINNYTEEQYDIFKQAINKIKELNINLKYKHLSATAGAIKINDEEINSIRLGIGLYGYNNLEEGDKYFQELENLKPALRFITKVVSIKNIKKDKKISYNCTYVSDKDKKIGLIPVGYYEGIPRELSNKLNILGKVCMNFTIIDISNNENIKTEDEIVLISENKNSENSIKNIAKLSNTIPYVILVKLSESIRRIVT